jgi:nucleoside-diphosphate-sugar epimerase
VGKRKIVITGAAGLVGRVLRDPLSEQYEVVALDRRRIGGPGARRVSLSSVRRLTKSFAEADTVVHLAADPSLTATWRSVARNNIVGTRNVLEAARRCGVRRIVFASSNAVTAGYEDDEPWARIVAGDYTGLDPAAMPRISTSFPVRPVNVYGVSKVFGEAACRYYADRFGVSAICLRIGTVRPSDRATRPRHFATLLTHRDLIALVTAAIEAPDDVRFLICYGVSNNTWRLYDLTEADQLGFRPCDDAEALRSASAAPS